MSEMSECYCGETSSRNCPVHANNSNSNDTLFESNVPISFVGYRPQPPSTYINEGISNGGWIPDYEGVIFSDGTVCIRWLTTFRSHSIWSNFETFYKVHGHPEYGTIIKYSREP